MLTDVSKAMGRSFFLGAFLPAVFLVTNITCAIVLVSDSKIVTEQIGFASIVAMCLAAAFFIATVFWSLNIWIVRLYEGYPIAGWQFNMRRVQSRREKLHKEIADLRAKLKTQRNKQGNHGDNLRVTDLQVKAEVEYPPASAELLPSKLGNIIRAFEYYPATRYNIETITVWPRLLAILSKSRLDAINVEKSLMDFWLNLSLALLISGIFWPVAMWYASMITWPFQVLIFIGGILLWYSAYRAAIPSAIAWGYEVRSAFDLYRCDLLRKLGFQRPSSLTREKGLWDKIFWFFTYEDYAKKYGLPSSDLPNQKKSEQP